MRVDAVLRMERALETIALALQSRPRYLLAAIIMIQLYHARE